jgi:large subunit ribosomal protein L21
MSEEFSTYAVVRAKGKQLIVKTGDVVTIEHITAEPGQEVTFEDILVVSKDGTTSIGNPVVQGAQVAARVLRHTRGPKLVAFKKKRRKGYKKKIGHRQELTVLKVEDIRV